MKKVSILVPEDTAAIAVTGPFDILMEAGKFWMSLDPSRKVPYFDIEMVSVDDLSVRTQSNYQLTCHTSADKIKKTDLILIPSLAGDFKRSIETNWKFVEMMKRQYRKGAEIASFCTGTFLLAATNLLNGKSATTHWAAADQFHQLFPDVRLVPDKVLVDEGTIYSSGGAMSYLNLLLYLVEKYCGRETSIFASKGMLIDMQKSPQSTYAVFQGQKNHMDEAILKVQDFIEKHLDRNFNIDDLARMALMSRRNFVRRFKEATGNSAKEYIQRVKVEEARRLLEFTNKKVQEIFYKLGSNDHVSFRKIFKKYTGLLPGEYRKKFILPG
jgi:transcriptional regulator GlxA family with amidase domain